MAEMMNEEVVSTRKLVLGFDAGCGTCSDLAGRIEERVGDKLSVENLNDPQLIAWREEALGKNAKWTPTLFEVEGEKVLHASAGWRMGWTLTRSIGTAATWQVMQALGEVGEAPKLKNSRLLEKLPPKAAETAAGMSRGQFLKGVGGAAVALSVLSGGTLLPSVAEAATSGWDSVRQRRLSGTELARIARDVSLRRDVLNVAGKALSNGAQIDAAKPQAVRHKLRNGGTMLAVAYALPNMRSLIYREYRNIPNVGTSTRAKLWQIDGSRVILINASEGGYHWQKTQTQTLSTASGIQPLAYCPPVGGGGGGLTPDEPRSGDNRCGSGYYYTTKVCVNHNYSCILNCAGNTGGCGYAAKVGKKPNPVTLGLVGLICANAINICYRGGTCCTGYKTVRRPCNPAGPAGDAL